MARPTAVELDGKMVGNVENVRILKEADSRCNHGIGLEGLEPGTFFLTKYEVRALLTNASGYLGLRIIFPDGEVDMVGKCVADLYNFCQEQVG
jgi:hypothetical protein